MYKVYDVTNGERFTLHAEILSSEREIYETDQAENTLSYWFDEGGGELSFTKFFDYKMQVNVLK